MPYSRDLAEHRHTLSMGITHITVRGARQHNLRNVDVTIPRNTLTVVTGLSGSGKSSLAFDTIYAEGQRRYVETFPPTPASSSTRWSAPTSTPSTASPPPSPSSRKPPAAALAPPSAPSPRSTTTSACSTPASASRTAPTARRPISRQSADQIVERIAALSPGERITVYAPIVRGRKGEFREELEALDQQGFRARIDGEMVELTEGMRLEKRKNHTIEAIVDRIILKPLPPDNANAALANAAPKYDTRRLETSVLKALQMANGLVLIGIQARMQDETLYSSSMACPDCGINVPRLEPRSFSFNSNYGACPECHGLGSIYDFDPAKTITDWSKPLLDGAMGPGSGSAYLLRLIKLAAEKYKINIKQPFESSPRSSRTSSSTARPRGEAGRTGFHGIFNYLRANLEDTKSEGYREYMMQYMSATICPVCKGRRLRPESLAVTVNGASHRRLHRAIARTRTHRSAQKMNFTGRDRIIADRLQREIIERLEFLNAVGLGYLSLDRSAATLSGGEGQRIRLATQIGSRLRGVLYVLDEPSHRPASARQPAPHQRARKPARPRQHRPRRRAR